MKRLGVRGIALPIDAVLQSVSQRKEVLVLLVERGNAHFVEAAPDDMHHRVGEISKQVKPIWARHLVAGFCTCPPSPAQASEYVPRNRVMLGQIKSGLMTSAHAPVGYDNDAPLPKHEPMFSSTD